MDSTELGRGGKKLLQFKDAFRSGEDAVALAHFSVASWEALNENRRAGIILDLGCGAGMILTLLLDSFPDALGFGIEKVARLAELARRNMRENGLESRSQILTRDARVFEKEAWPWGGVDLLVCNPPYRSGLPRGGIAVEQGEGAGDLLTSLEVVNDNLALERQLARFDFALNVHDLARLAAILLDEEGCFCMVFPLKRGPDLIAAMRSQKLFLNRWRKLRGWSAIEPKQGLYCFTHWTGKEAIHEDDVVLRQSR